MKTAKRLPRRRKCFQRLRNNFRRHFHSMTTAPKVYPNSSRAQMGLSCRFSHTIRLTFLNFQSFSLFDSSFHIFVFPYLLFFHLFSIFFPSFLSSSLFCRFRILPSSPFSFSPLSFALLPCVLLHRISSVLLLPSPPFPVVLRHVLISPCSSPFLLSFTCETVDPSRWPVCVQSAVSKTAVAFCAQLAAGPKGLGRAQTTSDVGDPKAAQTSREGAG